MKKHEYIWLDGYKPEQTLRSKVKVTDEDAPPDWAFDGSSTQQAEGGNSDCILKPTSEYVGPLSSDKLVMCEVLSPDKTPHPSNTRRDARDWFPTNGGLGMSKNIFSLIQRTAQYLAGKTAPLDHKEITIVGLVLAMLSEEKFQRRTWMLV